MSDLLKGAPLFRNVAGKPGQPVQADVLRGKVVVLFFGAKAAGTDLNAKLRAFYEANVAGGLEVVYISHDNSEDEMKAFLKEHPAWTYLKYGDPKAISLFQRYQLKAIPSLIVVQKGGTPLKTEALDEVYYGDATTVFAKWKKLTAE